MPISHLFNLAKALLRKKKTNTNQTKNIVPEKQMKILRVYVQQSPDHSGQPMIQAGRAAGSSCSPVCSHGQTHSSAAQGTHLTPLAEHPGEDATASALRTTTSMWSTRGAAWGEGSQVGQGKRCRAMQALCPGLDTFNKAL